jgi:hypothetical protein
MPNPLSSVAKLAGEAVVKPVTDEFGKIVETGAQSLTGTPAQANQNSPQTQPDPQKKQAEQTKIINIRQFLTKLQTQEQQYAQQQMLKKQLEQQKTQEEQERKQVKQFEFVQKQQKITTLQQAQRHVELKKGAA